MPTGEGPDIGAYESNYFITSVPLPDVADLQLSAWPNPFNPMTRVHYRLDEPGPVLLEVLNLRGQRVALLDQGVKAAGSHELNWRGEDANGWPVASGLYMVRLRAAGTTTTHNLTLIR